MLLFNHLTLTMTITFNTLLLVEMYLLVLFQEVDYPTVGPQELDYSTVVPQEVDYPTVVPLETDHPLDHMLIFKHYIKIILVFQLVQILLQQMVEDTQLHSNQVETHQLQISFQM